MCINRGAFLINKTHLHPYISLLSEYSLSTLPPQIGVFGMKGDSFLKFGWDKSFEKCYPNQLIFLKIKENNFPSKIKENFFENSPQF